MTSSQAVEILEWINVIELNILQSKQRYQSRYYQIRIDKKDQKPCPRNKSMPAEPKTSMVLGSQAEKQSRLLLSNVKR